MMHDCPSKDKDLDPKGKKILQFKLESNEEWSEDYLSEFYFIAIAEKKEEDFERPFEELYGEMAKKSK